MFERFLGPRLDHDDPQVRAKGYGMPEVDVAQLNAALATEQHPEVLAVIIERADHVRSLLQHVANPHSSLANAARTRLLYLAADAATSNELSASDEARTKTAANEWQDVFDLAITQRWSQCEALIEHIGRRNTCASLIEGALNNQQKHHLISEPVLKKLAINASSSNARLCAARALQSEDALQACASASKDKDKSVYREVRTRLDNIAAARQRVEQAQSLQALLRSLAEQQIAANSESLTGLHAKWQQANKDINALLGHAAQDPDIEPLRTTQADLTPIIEQKIHGARDAIKARQEILDEAQVALAAPSFDGVLIEALEQRWQVVPDHSELEQRQFSNCCKALKEKRAQQSQQDDRVIRAQKLIDSWQAQTATKDPDRALVQFDKAWAQLTMPDDASSRDELVAQSVAIQSKLRDAAKKLDRKKAGNDQKLREIRDQFKQAIDNGDLKLATSLHDKIRSRLSHQALNDDTRKDVESTVRTAQSKLDEYRKWRHFGTQQARENLLGEANKLLSDPPASPKVLAAKVKALREAWRKLDQDDGRASEAQWESFNGVCKEAYKPAKQHFNNLSKERKANYRDKQAVIASLVELHKETDWKAPDWQVVTQAIKEAQQSWQRTGAVDFKMRKEIDRDYTVAMEQIDAQLKDEREAEVTRRQRLISQLNKSLEDESIDQAVNAAKKAQRQWKPTVQAERKLEQSLWEEFRGICDEVFGRLKQNTKELKAAWQAEAKERESWIDEMDGLLKAEAEPVANAAAGRAEELAGQWRQRSQIPKPVMLKLDKRFRAARKSFDQRLKGLRTAEASQQQALLSELLELCQNAEAALLSGASAEQWTAHADDFEPVRGALAKHLRKRFESALRGMEGDAAVAERLQAQQSAALNSRQALCLRGELVADISSPADTQEARKQLQLERLKESLQGGGMSVADELAEIHDQWFQLPGVSKTDWPDLRQRFVAIQAQVKS